MKKRNESGEVVVEASVVVTLVLLVITLMLYIGMVLYQQTLISVMANQTASNIAQVYSNNLKDPFTGYVVPDKVYQSITYSNMKTDAYMDVIEQKANVFSLYRLKTSRIISAENTSVEVDIVKKPNELLRSQIVVTVRDRYEVPLVGFFGANGKVEFAASGRADCIDILEYINGVEAIGDPETSNVTNLPDTETCTVTFIPDRNKPTESSFLFVLKGKSVMSSGRYTHCVMPANPKRSGLEFAGWVTEKGTAFTASTTVNESMVVYGSWKCTVTLNANDGKVNSKSTYSFKTIIGKRAYLPSATRSGYHFAGWYTQKNGKGTRYLSNDSIITGPVTLYAHWTCAHPSRRESHRVGNICEGGTIYYKCTQCNADMGTGWYGGNGHQFVWRCNVAHSVGTFSGYGSGGCGYFHYYKDDQTNYYDLTPYKHSNKPTMYCHLCKFCYQSTRIFWCGVHGRYVTSRAPSNGHQW